MKEIPILFSTPMVQAILDGRKTQTRRTKGLEFINDSYSEWKYLGTNDDGLHLMKNEHDATNGIKCPYGKPGDVLWVRETWGHEYGGGYLYKASHEHMQKVGGLTDHKWRPSLFMPREACRLRLKITNVRVQRLWDISGPDCWAEGISHAGWNSERYGSVVECYRNLWQSIYGPESWNANPWVWVVEFELIK